MLDLFSGLRQALKRQRISIDNTIFQLHWWATGLVLAGFSLLMTAKQYVGIPITCFNINNVPSDLLNTYCWIHSTFTIEQAFKLQVGVEVAHPGVDNSRNGNKKYYGYYQWVSFILFLQAILFYIPHYLWKIWEGGLLHAVAMGLTGPVISEDERRKRINLLADYLKRYFGQHQFYALKYYFCEFLCLGNIVGQMYLLNRFFDGEFFAYGYEVIQFSLRDQKNSVDPMIYVFPRMTKCTFFNYGYSGDLQKHDTMCLLPLNIINEKIFIFIWFWFTILSGLTVLALLHRVLVLVCPIVRPRMLHVRSRMAHRDKLDAILSRSNVGDWFLLYMISKNVDGLVFREVISELSRKMGRVEQIDTVDISNV